MLRSIDTSLPINILHGIILTNTALKRHKTLTQKLALICLLVINAWYNVLHKLTYKLV